MDDSRFGFACRRRTVFSFDCNDTDALAHVLISHRFEQCPTNLYERYRLVNPTRTMFAVIFETGAVVAQGRHRDRLAAFIARAGGAS